MKATANRRGIHTLLAMLALGLGQTARAQAQTADAGCLDRLRDTVQTEVHFVEAESLDAHQPLLAKLEELRDEVGYLRVRQRRGSPVDESECAQVEAQLSAVRDQVRRADAQPRDAVAEQPEIPIGAELDAQVRHRIAAGLPNDRQEFEATVVTDLVAQGRTIVPAGSRLRGSARHLDASSRTDRRWAVAIQLHDITVRARTYAVDMRVMQVVAAGSPSIAIEWAAEGTLLTSEARAVDLAAGAILRVRFESPLELTNEP